MIICHCLQLNDRTIRGAIRDGACSREELTKACGAGGGCGGCQPALDELLQQERAQRATSRVRLTLLPSSLGAG